MNEYFNKVRVRFGKPPIPIDGELPEPEPEAIKDDEHIRRQLEEVCREYSMWPDTQIGEGRLNSIDKVLIFLLTVVFGYKVHRVTNQNRLLCASVSYRQLLFGFLPFLCICKQFVLKILTFD